MSRAKDYGKKERLAREKKTFEADGAHHAIQKIVSDGCLTAREERLPRKG